MSAPPRRAGGAIMADDQIPARVPVGEGLLRRLLRRPIYTGLETYGPASRQNETLRIVDDDVFAAVQRQLARRGTRPRAAAVARTHLLNGLLRCGRCGGPVDGHASTPRAQLLPGSQSRTPPGLRPALGARVQRRRLRGRGGARRRGPPGAERARAHPPRRGRERGPGVGPGPPGGPRQRSWRAWADIYRHGNISAGDYAREQGALKAAMEDLRGMLDWPLERRLAEVAAVLAGMPTRCPTPTRPRSAG